MEKTINQLVSYIAPSAPATRRPADGTEPRVRPEIGFTPAWYRQHLDIDFGRRWHTDPRYRYDTVVAMRDELSRRFPNTSIGNTSRPIDILTGMYGASTIAGIYGVPIVYAQNNWPNCEHRYLSDEEVDALQPPDLANNAFFQELMSQLDWIAETHGRIEGYINWQGVLNNAQRLRGQQVFMDFYEQPDRARHLLDCVCTTMIDAAQRVHARQLASGVTVGFFTVSNCLVNMVSGQQYAEFFLPLDCRIAETFGWIGIHNCAWNADAYMDHYAQVPYLGYIDMGIDSDLRRAREMFPDCRRAIMYTPMDLANKSDEELRSDFRRIDDEYAPCDVVLADIEAGTPDERIWTVLEICEELNDDRE